MFTEGLVQPGLPAEVINTVPIFRPFQYNAAASLGSYVMNERDVPLLMGELQASLR